MNYNTHIAVVLDRSGSMESLKREIIGGFNAFLKDQKETPGEATMTLVQFDNDIDRLTSFKPLKEVSDLTDSTYVPRGCTRLYDAIGLTVNTVKDEIAKAATKPDKVLVCIITDGFENASQEYETDSIKSLLEAQQKEGWQFTFIGANQDAILTAKGVGLTNAMSNMTYAASPIGAQNMMASLSRATTSYRCCAEPNAMFAYTQEDKDLQTNSPAASYQFTAKATFSEAGSKGGNLGGAARASSLTQKQRTRIASDAAKARWSKHSV